MNTLDNTNTSAVIYIVDDDRLARDSLQWLVESAHLSAQAFEHGERFLQHINKTSQGCVILDIRMPDINGMELYARLKASGITLPVIIVTGHADVAMAVRAMKAGAFDFIEKPYNDALMLELIQTAMSQDRQSREHRQRIESIQYRINQLTTREYEIMTFVLSATQNKIIAHELGISIKTVELHRANLMTKMSASSPTELVRMAMLAGADIAPEYFSTN